MPPAQAIQEANRWLARAEAIVRRPLAPRGASPAAKARRWITESGMSCHAIVPTSDPRRSATPSEW